MILDRAPLVSFNQKTGLSLPEVTENLNHDDLPIQYAFHADSTSDDPADMARMIVTRGSNSFTFAFMESLNRIVPVTKDIEPEFQILAMGNFLNGVFKVNLIKNGNRWCEGAGIELDADSAFKRISEIGFKPTRLGDSKKFIAGVRATFN